MSRIDVKKLYNEWLDSMIEQLVDEEDSRLLSSIDNLLLDVVFLCSIRLSGGHVKLTLERLAQNGAFCFTLNDRRKHAILKRMRFDYLLDGIEYFMSLVGDEDSAILWNWYLENGGGYE